MIFVSVGFHNQGFLRLIKKMDEIAGKIDEVVIMQIGHTDYTPQNAEFFDFKDSDENIKELCNKARVVVTHGGMAIMTALEQGTPVIGIPRLQKYGEHTNDHQIDIIDKFAKDGGIIAVREVDEIEDALEKIDGAFKMCTSGNTQLVAFIKDYIKQIE